MRLRVRGLRAGYGSSEVVHGIDLDIKNGEIVAVIGRNGMGKTTMLKAIVGLIRRWEGTVEVAGRDVSREPAHRVIRAGVAYLPHEDALFNSFTVAENLHGATLSGHGSRASLSEATEHFPFLAQRLGQPAGTLSGGEQRMLLLARALAARPKFLVIDEVCDGLHPPVVRTTVEVLQDYRRRYGMSVLMVEPNLHAVLQVADRVLVMKSGRFVLERESAAPDARQALERELVFA